RRRGPARTAAGVRGWSCVVLQVGIGCAAQYAAEEAQAAGQVAPPVRPFVAAVELFVAMGDAGGVEAGMQGAVGVDEGIVAAAVEADRRQRGPGAEQGGEHAGVFRRL